MIKDKFSVIKNIIGGENDNLRYWPYHQTKYKKYIDTNNTWNIQAKRLIKEFNQFKNLLIGFDKIKGITNTNKEFTLNLNDDNTANLKLYYDKTKYYTENIKIVYLFYYGIISYINKLENALVKSIVIPRERYEQNIFVKGVLNDKEYSFVFNIYTGSYLYLSSNLDSPNVKIKFKYDNKIDDNFRVSYQIPNHINVKQYFRYLFTLLTTPKTVLGKIEEYYHNNKTYCCSKKFDKYYKFCPVCGTEVIKPKITIDDISYSEKWTILNK